MLFRSLYFMLSWVLAFDSPYSMLATYGEPTNAWDPRPIDTGSWDTCVRLCYLDTYCIVAHMTPAFCNHYNVGKVYRAQRLTSANESLIAIKGNKSSSATCQTELSDISQTVYILNSSVSAMTSYLLKLSGDQFTFTYYLYGFCDANWQAFFRADTMYCMSVNTDFTTVFDKDTAEQRCAAMGATLAGLETEVERVWVTNQMNWRYQWEPTYNNLALWVSGDRKVACRILKQGWKKECTGIVGFTFSDPYLKYKLGYQWAPGQPDSYITENIQNCIQIWAMRNPADPKHGLVDDATCDFKNNTTFAMRGYVCGRPYKPA